MNRSQKRLARYRPTYWANNGKYQDLYEELFATLVPARGKADTEAGELLRSVSRIYWDLYNNGWGNGPWDDEWNTIEEHASQFVRFMSNPQNYQKFFDFFYGTDYGEESIGEAPPNMQEALDDIVDGIVQVVGELSMEELGRDARVKRFANSPGTFANQRTDLAEHLRQIAERVDSLSVGGEDSYADNPDWYEDEYGQHLRKGFEVATRSLSDIERAFKGFF